MSYTRYNESSAANSNRRFTGRPTRFEGIVLEIVSSSYSFQVNREPLLMTALRVQTANGTRKLIQFRGLHAVTAAKVQKGGAISGTSVYQGVWTDKNGLKHGSYDRGFSLEVQSFTPT